MQHLLFLSKHMCALPRLNRGTQNLLFHTLLCLDREINMLFGSVGPTQM